jgi:peptidylprolyl isomerase
MAALLVVGGCDKPAETKAAKAPSDKAGAAPEAAAAAAPDAGAPTAAVDVPADAGKAWVEPQAPEHLQAPPDDATKERSGLAWKPLEPGSGEARPQPDDRVKFHFDAWKPTGELATSTWRDGEPKEMRVRKIVSGYREALQGMAVGERRRVWIPGELALPKSKASSPLDRRVVDLTLVALAKAPPAPKDLKRPPKAAKKTDSGLVYAELKAGEGMRSPEPKGAVTVRYAGWTKDGRCFDFTGPDETASFGVEGVIAGWTEGLQLMVEGQRLRLWIPQELAYQGKRGKPKGPLVFDIELVSIQ